MLPALTCLIIFAFDRLVPWLFSAGASGFRPRPDCLEPCGSLPVEEAGEGPSQRSIHENGAFDCLLRSVRPMKVVAETEPMKIGSLRGKAVMMRAAMAEQVYRCASGADLSAQRQR